MSLLGRRVAQQHGQRLPSFKDSAEATSALFALRDSALEALSAISKSTVPLDYTPDSLKMLERWCLDEGTSVSPQGLGFYWGEVLCRNAGFQWLVSEYPFQPGRYEVGVQRGPLSIMLTLGRSVTREKNKNMNSLWREYRKYAL